MNNNYLVSHQISRQQSHFLNYLILLLSLNKDPKKFPKILCICVDMGESSGIADHVKNESLNLMPKANSLEKTLMLERLRAGGEADNRG